MKLDSLKLNLLGGGLVMKRLLTLSLILGFAFSAVRSDETGWSYKITTNQAFYYFQQSNLIVDGAPIESDDVIGAFSSSDVCVGWALVSEAIDANGFITVNTVGQTGADEYAADYLSIGEVPTFRVYDATYGDASTPATQKGVMPLAIEGDDVYWFVPSDPSQAPVSGAFNNLESFQLNGSISTGHSLACDDIAGACNSLEGPYTFYYVASGDAFVETGSSTTALGGCLYNDCAGVCPDAVGYEESYEDDVHELCCTDSQRDECGVCGGPGEYTYYEDQDGDGLGDALSTTLSCSVVAFEAQDSDVDGYVANNDDSLPLCASNTVDDCGICDGDSSSCTGCTESTGDNFNDDCTGVIDAYGNLIEDGCTIDDGSCDFSLDTPEILNIIPGPAKITFEISEVADADRYDLELDGVLVGSGNSCSDGVCTIIANDGLPVPEDFVDDNSNGQYDAGEEFTDDNGNGIYDGELCIDVYAVDELDLYDDFYSDAAVGCAAPLAVEGIGWGWRLTGDIDGYGMFPATSENNILGFSVASTALGAVGDGYDPGFDIPEPPIGASQNYIAVYFEHDEYGQDILGDFYTQDIRNYFDSDMLACDGDPNDQETSYQCNLIEFEATIISDMTGEASLTFDLYSTANHNSNGQSPVSVPQNVHTYAELDGQHYLIEDGTTIPIELLSAGMPKIMTITIGNIVPQAPENFDAEGDKLSVNLSFNEESSDINDIANRYPTEHYNLYRDGEEFREITSNSTTDAEDQEGRSSYGLLWESSYDYTATGTNVVGESTKGHNVNPHAADAGVIEVAGRQSDASATTDDNADPVATTAHNGIVRSDSVTDEDGTDFGNGHYEVQHDGTPETDQITVSITGESSRDDDTNLLGAESDINMTYSWTLEAGDIVSDDGLSDDHVDFTVSNAHESDSKDVTYRLVVTTDYYVKTGSDSDLSNGDEDGVATRVSSYDNEDNFDCLVSGQGSDCLEDHLTDCSSCGGDDAKTATIDDEPNTDPIAYIGIVEGDGQSIVTYTEFVSEENDGNSYDSADQVWHAPHDGDPATSGGNNAHIFLDDDRLLGDNLLKSGDADGDDFTYSWEIISSSQAGFSYDDLNGNNAYDLGEPIVEMDDGIVIGDLEDINDSYYLDDNSYATANENTCDAEAGCYLFLDADVHVIRLTVTDTYDDSHTEYRVLGVSAERNADPVASAGIDQHWFMNYLEDTKEITLHDGVTFINSVSSTDGDQLQYEWTHSIDGGEAVEEEFDSGELDIYPPIPNDQDIGVGVHTFTLTVTDNYGATDSDELTILISNEPHALPASNVEVTNPETAYKHIEIRWDETVWGINDPYINENGVLIWTDEFGSGVDYANTDRFEVLTEVLVDGEFIQEGEIVSYDTAADACGADCAEGDAVIMPTQYLHLEPALNSNTTYRFTLTSFNSDNVSGGSLSTTAGLDHTTHADPTVTVLNPNGAEIASVGDNYDVDIIVTNPEFVSKVDIEYLTPGEFGDLTYMNEDEGEDGLYSSILASGDQDGEHTTQINSIGEEIHYDAKIRVTLTDVGNYHDLMDGTDSDHETGTIGGITDSVDEGEEGAREWHNDVSDDSFTMAAHSITKSLWDGWHLFGPSMTPYNSPIGQNLGTVDSFGDWGLNWVAYTQAGEFDTTDVKLELGVGYYLALASSDDMVLHGDPVTGDPDYGHLHSLSIKKGWNLVSNPLVTMVDVDLLKVSESGSDDELSWEHASNAGWVQTNINTWFIDSHMHADQLVPFGGYWIHSSRDVDVHVNSHLNSYSTRKNEVSNGWDLMLSASDALSDAAGDFVTISLREDANNEFVYGEDEIDHPNPIQPNFIDMHINRFDWVGNADSRGIIAETPYFSSDVRSINDLQDMQVWEISAEAYNVPGDITLSWEMTDDIDLDLHLVVNGEAYDIKALDSIDVPSHLLNQMVVVMGDLGAYLGPQEFALSNAYPNPFNPTTSLDLSLVESAHVSIKVYNVVGQVVATLASGQMSAGYHSIAWDASNVSSGMYFIKVDAGTDVAVQKVMLMK